MRSDCGQTASRLGETERLTPFQCLRFLCCGAHTALGAQTRSGYRSKVLIITSGLARLPPSYKSPARLTFLPSGLCPTLESRKLHTPPRPHDESILPRSAPIPTVAGGRRDRTESNGSRQTGLEVSSCGRPPRCTARSEVRRPTYMTRRCSGRW